MNITLYRHPFRTFTALAPYYSPMPLMEEIEEIARDFSRRTGFNGETLSPYTDIQEEKDQLVVKTELPGINEADLEVTLEDNILTIKAEKKEETTEDTTHHTRERYYGTYVRSISLPYHVNGDKVSATFEKGVLELRLPKAEELKARRIEIKAQLPEAKPKRRPRKPKEKST